MELKAKAIEQEEIDTVRILAPDAVQKANSSHPRTLMGLALGLRKYLIDEGDVIGISRFGESAPSKEVMEEYGFIVENTLKKGKARI